MKFNELLHHGQSIWLDFISRSYIQQGTLGKYVNSGVRGVTSNPTIFEKAINGSNDYDESIKILSRKGLSAEEIYDALVIDDIRHAADTLLSVYEQSQGKDGYVSLEVSPQFAHNTKKTVEQALEYVRAILKPNIMIKVPATQEGLPAITELISHGINVNVTLMFSIRHFHDVADAYMTGLEKLLATGGTLSKVNSVASFFVSRVDTIYDGLLEKKGKSDLMGKAAVANSKLTYAEFQTLLQSDRWKALAAKGANVQRLLWASTSTKNPSYPDTLYIDTLIGPHTVNTVPPNALQAFLHHGTASESVTKGVKEARTVIEQCAQLGISYEDATEQLQKEGVAAFAKSFETLMGSIEEKRKRLAHAG